MLPDATVTTPLFPFAAVPDENNTRPLSPALTAFADRTTTIPELEEAPAPETTPTEPPFEGECVVAPARTYTSPPEPESVEPTVTETEPADPLVASPEAMETCPEPPRREVPVLKTMAPDEPSASTAPEAMTTPPEEPESVVPEETKMEPEEP